jgi:hypothetical protein
MAPASCSLDAGITLFIACMAHNLWMEYNLLALRVGGSCNLSVRRLRYSHQVLEMQIGSGDGRQSPLATNENEASIMRVLTNIRNLPMDHSISSPQSSDKIRITDIHFGEIATERNQYGQSERKLYTFICRNITLASHPQAAQGAGRAITIHGRILRVR